MLSFASAAAWGNISLGDDAEVTLNSPEGGAFGFGDIIFNISIDSVNVTPMNLTLFTNETGIWEARNTTTDVFGEENFTDNSVRIQDDDFNYNVTAIKSGFVTFIGGTRDAETPPAAGSIQLRVTITQGGDIIAQKSAAAPTDSLGNVTFTSSDYTSIISPGLFNIRVENIGGTDSMSKGSSASFSGELFSISSQQVNTLGGFGGGTKSITYEGLHDNLIQRRLNNSILWNAEACGSDGECGFATQNRTYLAKYLERNRTHNNESFQTEEKSFNVNIEGATLVTLFYNGTEYTTTKSGTNFNRTLQIPIGSIGNNSIYWRVDGVIDTLISYQNVSETVFTLCNATYNTLFLNVSFKDESDSSALNASIPTSTFVYYLGDGTVSKTYNFINTSDNYAYEFCATPNRTLKVDSFFQYKQGTAYPQRVADPGAIEYTNVTTNTTLFLLGVADGLFVTFQTINSAQQIISGVLMTAIRSIAGEDQTVGVGTTGDSGSVTLWLNPDFIHDFLFTKSGFTDQSLSFAPTQTSYTITMGEGAGTVNSTIKGIDYSVTPINDFLENDTTYSFGFILTSNFWDVSEYGFNLRLSNGTIITGDTSTVSGTQLTTSYDVNNQTLIFLDAFWLINGEYTNITRTWSVQNTEYLGWSIKTFFADLTIYLDSGLFGLDNFGRLLIAFIIIFISVGIMGQKFGITSSLGITSLLFGVVLFFDVVTGILPDIRGVANLPTFIAGLVLTLAILNEVQSR